MGQPALGGDYWIGIDLGGTNTRLAAAGSGGAILGRAAERLPPLDPADPVGGLLRHWDRLRARIEAAAGLTGRLAGIGLAVPGFVDATAGTVSVLANVFGQARDIPLRDRLARRWGAPVWLENDVKAAALGELHQGWGRELATFIFLAIGTGTAAAAILDRRLWRGARGQAGEIAFALTGREFLGQDFGENGCLESFASGYGIGRQSGAAAGAEAAQAPAVFAAAAAGDAGARDILSAAWDHLAVGLSGAITMLDPEAVILGGGIGLRPEPETELRARLSRALPYFPVRILRSRLGADAQLLGALAGARGVSAAAQQR
ncbi:MAG: ROK family protein [Terriglobales bacterium]